MQHGDVILTLLQLASSSFLCVRCVTGGSFRCAAVSCDVIALRHFLTIANRQHLNITGLQTLEFLLTGQNGNAYKKLYTGWPKTGSLASGSQTSATVRKLAKQWSDVAGVFGAEAAAKKCAPPLNVVGWVWYANSPIVGYC